MTAHRLQRSLIAATLGAATALPAMAQDRPVVAASNYPLAYFAERLGKGVVDVVFPIPADVDPSFWRPAISDIAAIQSADLIALNGAGFATWPTKASLPRSRTVDTSAGFSDRFIKTETVTHSHGDGGEHSHTGVASYTWLDFELAAAQATALSEAMIRQMPDDAGIITGNHDTLLAELAALDTRAMEVGAGAEGLTIITSHPRYQYFAAAYGLTAVALEWDAMTEPTDAQWDALQAVIADTQAGLFIWEAAPTAASRERLAGLGIKDVVFPPMANRGDDPDFIVAMTESLEALDAALAQVR